MMQSIPDDKFDPTSVDPAFPQSFTDGKGQKQIYIGMGMRAYIATAALQGLLYNVDLADDYVKPGAELAVKYADALIAELAK